MLPVDNTLVCMFQLLCTYFQVRVVLIFGGYVLSGHCSYSKLQYEMEGVDLLIFGGYIFTGFYGIT